MLLFTSCLTTQKVDKFLDKHPDYNAKNCATKFPIVADTIINTITDTAILYSHDTIVNNDTQRTVIIKPEGKIVTRTITIVKESTAKLADLQFSKTKDSLMLSNQITFYTTQLHKSSKDCDDLKIKLKAIRKRNLSLLALVIALSILLFRKPILRLIGLSL